MRIVSADGVLSRVPDKVVKGEFMTLAKAYILGEELIDTKFQENVLSAMRSRKIEVAFVRDRWTWAGELIDIIYEGTLEGSPARDFMLELHGPALNKTCLTSRRKTFHVDFLFDLLVYRSPAMKILPTMDQMYV